MIKKDYLPLDELLFVIHFLASRYALAASVLDCSRSQLCMPSCSKRLWPVNHCRLHCQFCAHLSRQVDTSSPSDCDDHIPTGTHKQQGSHIASAANEWTGIAWWKCWLCGHHCLNSRRVCSLCIRRLRRDTNINFAKCNTWQKS